MPLTIGNKQYEGKMNFKFERRANEKYNDENFSGVEKIYQDLMQYKISALLAFWDCATAHYKKDQPSVEDIENALEEAIEEEGAEQLFRETFQKVDESGFFKMQIKEFWKNIDMAEKMAKDEEEKEQAKMLKKYLKDKHKELTE